VVLVATLAVCLIGFPRAGLGPSCRPTFCCQKVGKEPAPTAPDPPAAPAGNLRRQPLVAVRQNSLRVFDAPFKHVAASQRLMRLHSAVQPRATRGHRRRREHKGQHPMRDSFLVFLIAATSGGI